MKLAGAVGQRIIAINLHTLSFTICFYPLQLIVRILMATQPSEDYIPQITADRTLAIAQMEVAAMAIYDYRDRTGRDPFTLMCNYPGYHTDYRKTMLGLSAAQSGKRTLELGQARNITTGEIVQLTQSLRRALEDAIRSDRKEQEETMRTAHPDIPK